MTEKYSNKLITFAPETDKVVPFRSGSKSAIAVEKTALKEGIGLPVLAAALSKSGQTCSAQYARSWVAKSFFAPHGYGMMSCLSARGGLRLFSFTTQNRDERARDMSEWLKDHGPKSDKSDTSEKS